MGALSEYARLVGGRFAALRPPSDFGGLVHWLVLLVAAYLAIRLVLALVRTLFRG